MNNKYLECVNGEIKPSDIIKAINDLHAQILVLSMGPVRSGPMLKEEFTATAGQVTVTTLFSSSGSTVILNGSHLDSSSYSILNSVVTFAVPLTVDDHVEILSAPPVYIDTITAVTGQTEVQLSYDGDASTVVYVNNIIVISTTYTITGKVLKFNTPLVGGEKVSVITQG